MVSNPGSATPNVEEFSCQVILVVITERLRSLSTSLFLHPQSLLWLTTGRDSIEQALVITLLVIMDSASYLRVTIRAISRPSSE